MSNNGIDVVYNEQEVSVEVESNVLKGPKGENGKSAYEIWLEQGNAGTEKDFLNSIRGEDMEALSNIELEKILI